MAFGSILDLITSASLCGGCLVGLMNERFDELNGFQSKKNYAFPILLKKNVSFMNLTFLERKEQREFHSFSHGKRSAFLSLSLPLLTNETSGSCASSFFPEFRI